MHLFEIFLPTTDEAGHPHRARLFDGVRKDLTERFGGVTAFLRRPGQGLWRDANGEVRGDDIVVFEVMCDRIDRDWWPAYRRRLEILFEQELVLIRVSSIETI